MYSLDKVFGSALRGPVQLIESGPRRDIRLLIKRDDLLFHPEAPEFCGNKWRKLKYNLFEARRMGKQHLLTFGGAFSNHIIAVAAAGYLTGFQTTGVIRGEADYAHNPTLSKAREYGMNLHFISREEYRQKDNPEMLQRLPDRFGDAYIIPEGGSNTFALQGCEELALEIIDDCKGEIPDVVCCSCGTGGTFGGLISGFKGQTLLIGFPALKGSFMTDQVKSFLPKAEPGNWSINSDYHFGGYAKHKSELLNFIREFYERHQILLDPVYTGKMMYGICDLIARGHFSPGTTIVAVHTGGTQGNAGMNLRLGQKQLPE